MRKKIAEISPKAFKAFSGLALIVCLLLVSIGAFTGAIAKPAWAGPLSAENEGYDTGRAALIDRSEPSSSSYTKERVAPSKPLRRPAMRPPSRKQQSSSRPAQLFIQRVLPFESVVETSVEPFLIGPTDSHLAGPLDHFTIDLSLYDFPEDVSRYVVGVFEYFGSRAQQKLVFSTITSDDRIAVPFLDYGSTTLLIKISGIGSDGSQLLPLGSSGEQVVTVSGNGPNMPFLPDVGLRPRADSDQSQ